MTLSGLTLFDHTVGARVSLEEERNGLELAIAAE